MTVFYSWQSDLPDETNRAFIREALDEACNAVAGDPTIEASPRMDQDIQGLSGSPSIPTAIMEKIDGCDAFVADVSLHFTSPSGKQAPNPNVAYELGYAVARIGWSRIILVLNNVSGSVDSLPFDLEKRYALSYSARDDDPAGMARAKTVLSGQLKARIEQIAGEIARQPPPVAGPTPAEAAIEAVESQTSARVTRIEAFWRWILQEFRSVEPDLRSDETPVQKGKTLEGAIGMTAPIVTAWSEVGGIVARSNDSEAAEALITGFEPLLHEYDLEPNSQISQLHSYWFDYWKFVGHELLVVWVAHLLKAKRWELIAETLDHTFYWDQKRRKTNDPLARFDEFIKPVFLFQPIYTNLHPSYHGQILSQRYGSSGIGSNLQWNDFVAADLFLYLASQLRVPKDYPRRSAPPTLRYSTAQPRFFIDARTANYVSGLIKAMGATSVEDVKRMIREDDSETSWYLREWVLALPDLGTGP